MLFVLSVQSFIRILRFKSVFAFTMEKFGLIFSKKLECEIWIMFLHDYKIILLIQSSALLCSLMFIFFSFLSIALGCHANAVSLHLGTAHQIQQV